MMKQTQRLTAALTDCGLSSIGDFDLEAIALRIDRAVIRFKVFADLESGTRAKDEREWVRSVGRHADELAGLLSKLPKGDVMFMDKYKEFDFAVAAAFLDEEFDFAVAATDYAADWVGGPGSIEPILRCLAQAADQVMTKPRLGLPSAPKKLGRSPQHRLIVCLAAVFAELAGEDARIMRIDREGRKGGPFFDFICALAARWEFRPPSAEAIATALRSA